MTRRRLVCAVVALAMSLCGAQAQRTSPWQKKSSGRIYAFVGWNDPESQSPLPFVKEHQPKGATPSHPYASTRPMRTPTLFSSVLDSLTGSSSPSFTPDGQTVYFTGLRSAHGFMPEHGALMMSHYAAGEWTKPEILEFSGQDQEGTPIISPDGMRMLFWSYRPLDKNAPPKQDSDIWMVERNGSGWGPPRNLGAPVNSGSGDYTGSVGHDGTLYLTSKRNGGERNGDIYCARLKDGLYTEPEHLGDAVNSTSIELGPTISPDGQMLVFSSNRPEGLGKFDLYITRQQNGQWMPAKNLGPPINSLFEESSPRFSPDGRYFFFDSNRGGKSQIYQIEASVLLERLAAAPHPDAPAQAPSKTRPIRRR